MFAQAGDRLRVASALAPMHGEPRISTAWVSQLLAGQVADVIEVQGDWIHLRGEDEYKGWVHRGYLEHASGSEPTWRISIGCRVREASGVERDLPLLARVAPSAQLLSGVAIDASERASRFPADPVAISESARTLFVGASYVWGGVSPWGCDCSGLVQSIYRLHGVAMPRDAAPQATHGVFDAERSLAALEASDLAFFSDRDDRNITHVGIISEPGRMAHSGLARGGFSIEQLDDDDDEYVMRLRKEYVGMRRVVP